MRNLGCWVWLFVVLGCHFVGAEEKEAEQTADVPPLTVERIFASGEFNATGLLARWADDGDGYLTVEGSEIVRHDAATGDKTVIVSDADLTPPGESGPPCHSRLHLLKIRRFPARLHELEKGLASEDPRRLLGPGPLGP